MKAELIDHMGDDLRVANAARVSFDKESEWEKGDWIEDKVWSSDVLRISGKDQKLIHYLANQNHWSPFSHCIIQMRETVPIFVARQRFKHIIGFTYAEIEEDGLEATYNEVSRRYVDDEPEFYYPEGWRKRADNKKQGSSDELIEDQRWQEDYEALIDYCSRTYEDMVDSGIAPEQARMVLPQSMYTSYYVTGSLAAWARAYNLRSDSHAQKEIQELAAQWNNIIQPLYPVSWKALTNV